MKGVFGRSEIRTDRPWFAPLVQRRSSHASGADEAARAGFIDGDACPWHARPGWQPLHCGIFGQFQAGVSSVYGLKYRLTTTIPRHGGDHCRIDPEPLHR